MSIFGSIFGKPSQWQNYRCNICGKQPSGPSVSSKYHPGYASDEGPGGFYTTETNWDWPADFVKCANCRQPTCRDCIEIHGWCKKCRTDQRVEHERQEKEEWERKPEWERRIETSLRQQRELEKARQIEEANNKAKEEQNRQKQLLREYQERFRCHICGLPSKEPGLMTFYGHVREDWSKPTGLEMCGKCKQWTCSQHIHMSICKACALKM